MHTTMARMRTPAHGALLLAPGAQALARRALLLALLALLLGPAAGVRGETNYFEQRKIEAQALQAFRQLVTLWREEVYFELYDHGMAASKARISREEFAQRMVELSWVPEGELNPKHLAAQFHFRTVVYVTARIPYRHKFNPDRRFDKEQTLLLLQEDGQWKVDLIALIRAPFSGA